MCTLVCRVCLAFNERMCSIDSKQMLSLYEKLTSTKLDTASMPRVICYICYSQLQRCRRFSELALKSENILKDLLHKGIEATHSTILELHPGLKSSLSTTPTQILVLNDFSSSSSPVNVKQEEIVHNDFGNGPTPLFIVKQEEIVHNDFGNGPAPLFIVKEEPIAEESTAEDSPSIDDSPETEPLPECPEATSKDIDLDNDCDTSNPVECDLTIHTGGKIYACHICDKQFSRKRPLTCHLRTHNGVKPYVCEICNHRCTGKNTLAEHMLTHTVEEPFTCDICHKQFPRIFTLSDHMRMHNKGKPYVCNICHKQFSQKMNLTVHMRTHTKRLSL